MEKRSKGSAIPLSPPEEKEYMQQNNPNTNAKPSESALRDLYDSLGVSTPLELSNKFTELDQEEISRSGEYDYGNGESAVNKIKDRLEAIDPTLLTDEENKWRSEILWLWNHHAAGMALFGRRDRATAQRFSEAALSHQAEDHPNMLTRLLYLLAHDDVAGAEEHIAAIPRDSVEYESALSAIETYKTLVFDDTEQ